MLRRLLNLVLIIEPLFVDKLKNLKENEISKLAHNFLDLENEQLTEAIFVNKQSKTTDYGICFLFCFQKLYPYKMRVINMSQQTTGQSPCYRQSGSF